jgi:hypothetical protein
MEKTKQIIAALLLLASVSACAPTAEESAFSSYNYNTGYVEDPSLLQMTNAH